MFEFINSQNSISIDARDTFLLINNYRHYYNRYRLFFLIKKMNY